MTDIRTKKGYGYLKDDGTQGLIRCHDCGRENYSMSVHSGVCAWCGFDANHKEPAVSGQTN